ncbi:hypothetical protein GPECTOR_27g730 [Gonium pectorale]|uniref:Uncharacterized protein n=1 Tax=Gonium pectorale TaxID=33097 RepID=A0A150GFC5_GONPE|nr:hypothetical protein GPECTOR_27g730 [Gonium pectorale]|eukprot:KXZ48559.1 hypothetical protein GPECTOR_27g730 [Gonium pectorale]
MYFARSPDAVQPSGTDDEEIELVEGAVRRGAVELGRSPVAAGPGAARKACAPSVLEAFTTARRGGWVEAAAALRSKVEVEVAVTVAEAAAGSWEDEAEGAVTAAGGWGVSKELPTAGR